MIATAKRKTEVMHVFPPFTLDDLRAVEAAAYEAGANSRQGECEWWGIGGLIVGVVYAAGLWFLMAW